MSLLPKPLHLRPDVPTVASKKTSQTPCDVFVYSLWPSPLNVGG
jgi:hypothetical protein